MKAMSKFFLIVSGALILIGAVLMIIGSAMAKSQGVQLFQEKVDGKYLYNLDLTDKEISKISIDATDTDIKVITGEESDFIEFINFNENYYSIATTNKVVKFEEHVSLSSMISFWDGNFKFKGMRSFLKLGGNLNGSKEILIHLKDTSEISVFDFTITDGDIAVSNADSMTDYKIAMNSGNVTFNNVRTKSKVMINGNNCSVSLTDCAIQLFESDITTVNMDASVSDVHMFDFTGKSGSVIVKLVTDTEKSSVAVSSEKPFTYNTQSFSEPYENSEEVKELQYEYATVQISGTDILINADITGTPPAAEEGSKEG